MTSSRTNWSNRLTGWVLLAIIVISCVFFSWIIITHKPQPSIPSDLRTVIEFSTCKGLDEKGNPTEISTIFSSQEKQIFVCGYLQTNQPITLSIYWYYEDELLFRDLKHNVQGRFISQLESTIDPLQEGIYEVQLVMDRAVVWRSKFWVKHS